MPTDEKLDVETTNTLHVGQLLGEIKATLGQVSSQNADTARKVDHLASAYQTLATNVAEMKADQARQDRRHDDLAEVVQRQAAAYGVAQQTHGTQVEQLRKDMEQRLNAQDKTAEQQTATIATTAANVQKLVEANIRREEREATLAEVSKKAAERRALYIKLALGVLGTPLVIAIGKVVIDFLARR